MVVAVGKTVRVTDEPDGLVGATVSVAGTLGNRVVGETGWTVKVVRTRGRVVGTDAETPADAETLRVSVAGADVANVVVCEGITTKVVDGSFGTAGASVSVAGTLGNKVVGEIG